MAPAYGGTMKQMKRRLLSVGVVVSVVAGAAGASENSTYTYDALGRLVLTSHSGGPRSGTTVASSYDEAGNRAALAVDVPLPAPTTAVTFAISGPSTVTKGATAMFTIAKSGPAATVVTVNFATANGTAVTPGDYIGAAGTLSFRAWETVKTVIIPIPNDGLGSPAKQFSMSLSSPSTGGSLGTATATATIAAAYSGPATTPDNLTVGTCSTKFINVVANDTDPSGSYPLTLVSVSAASAGVATIVNSTTISYHTYGYAANDTVTYTIHNAAGATGTGTLNVAIVDNGGCQ